MTIQTATRIYGEDVVASMKDIGKKCDDFTDGALMHLLKNEDLSHLDKKERYLGIKNLIEDCKGIFFDEAHHCPAQTAEKTLSKSTNAFYVFGGTATPNRADNADLVIEGLFGRKTAIIDASFLIKKGHLMKPNIYYIKLTKIPKRISSFAEDVNLNIVENEERNNHIISIAKTLANDDLSVLVLVSRIDHGKYLHSMIEDSEFIYGQTSVKKRQEVLNDLESKKTKIVISSTIADEGLDIPTLNVVILGGGGKSPNKCKQRVGRGIRKSPGKKCSLIFDFIDIGKHTKKHSARRRNMLRKESEFVIIDTDSFSKINRPPESKTLF
jgi:superfamily II DNA or RNA helicase